MNIVRKSYRNLKQKIKAFFELKTAKKTLQEYLQDNNGKKILLVSHMLTKHGGSPITFNNLLMRLVEDGYNPLVLGYGGGEFVEELRKMNIKVIVGNVFQYDYDAFYSIAKNFNKIVANSIVTYTAVDKCNNALWWIQEGQNIENDFMHYMKNLDRALINAHKIFVVSDYAKEVVEKYNKNCEIINLGVKDYSKEVSYSEIGSKVKFVLVGEINDCKAQDVLIDAILQLDKKYLDKTEFHFICNTRKGHRYRNIIKATKHLDNIHFDNIITDQKLKSQFFATMDAFIVPSRDEALSLVTLEACMLSKPVIVSENVGAKYMVKDGENGYIVKTGEPLSLKHAIEKITDNQSLDWLSMKKASRKMYEKYANEEILNNSINRLVEYIESL